VTVTATRKHAALQAGSSAATYALRNDASLGALDRVAARLTARLKSGQRSWRSLSRILRDVHRHDGRFSGLALDALQDAAADLGYRLKTSRLARPVVGETFALVSETAERLLGLRHFDVQLVGGWAMLNGMVAEMETGEGKTLTATLPACTAALAGIPVHVITVNDYLAERDAETMRPIYEALGLTVGVALASMSEPERKAAYDCDITYTTNKQVAFDHLRDRIRLRGKSSQMSLQFLDDRSGLLLRGLFFALVDEADSVLVDEAVTPLIISRRGKPLFEKDMLVAALEAAGARELGVHYQLNKSERRLTLTAAGEERLESWAEHRVGLWRNTRYRHELIVQALRALHLFERDQHYLVDEGKVKIIDEFTGRVLDGRSWEQGLHQLIEVKEDCEITGQMETIGRISYQRFFRRYLMLAGMSGTVHEVGGEMRDVYGLDVARIRTNVKKRRRVEAPRITVGSEEKWRRVVERIAAVHAQGRPVLVGTRAVSASEHLSELLRREGLPHRVLNARRDRDEAEIVAEAGGRGKITVATNMAGRGTDIKLGPGVAELGGLHVIATERHEARRIDRQLFGRCARQGDPGSFEEIVSLEDQLVALYLPEWLRPPARWLASTRGAGERLALALVTLAQRKAQARGARMRVQMQKMDEYLGNVLAFTGRLE
jgi:preprotein translocase subunit SecA